MMSFRATSTLKFNKSIYNPKNKLYYEKTFLVLMGNHGSFLDWLFR